MTHRLKLKPENGQAHPQAPIEPGAAAHPPELDEQRHFFTDYRLNKANIPRRFWNKTFENFSAKDASRRRLFEHFQRFVKSFNFEKEFPKGLLMIGQVGSGKSHLAVSIVRDVIAKGYTGLYYNSPDLLRDIRATFNNEGGMTEDDLLDEIDGVDLLVLDDLGAENVSGFVLDRFYLIINKRYEGCKPVILTTNLELEELRNRMGERIVSRLIEMCQIINTFPREDWRRRSLTP
jgi:DNA replication protein DnaC